MKEYMKAGDSKKYRLSKLPRALFSHTLTLLCFQLEPILSKLSLGDPKYKVPTVAFMPS